MIRFLNGGCLSPFFGGFRRLIIACFQRLIITNFQRLKSTLWGGWLSPIFRGWNQLFAEADYHLFPEADNYRYLFSEAEINCLPRRIITSFRRLIITGTYFQRLKSTVCRADCHLFSEADNYLFSEAEISILLRRIIISFRRLISTYFQRLKLAFCWRGLSSLFGGW